MRDAIERLDEGEAVEGLSWTEAKRLVNEAARLEVYGQVDPDGDGYRVIPTRSGIPYARDES